MANPEPQTEVLHNENHARLSTEEIAKALARHKKNHSTSREESLTAKAANAGGKPEKAKKTPKV